MKVTIVDKETGVIMGKMDKEFLLGNPKYEEFKVVLEEEEDKVEKILSYSEMKKVAKEKGLDIKGNIKKSELEDLINKGE